MRALLEKTADVGLHYVDATARVVLSLSLGSARSKTRHNGVSSMPRRVMPPVTRSGRRGFLEIREHARTRELLG